MENSSYIPFIKIKCSNFMKARQIFLLFILLVKMNSAFSQALFAKEIISGNHSHHFVVNPDSSYTLVMPNAAIFRINKLGIGMVQPYGGPSFPYLRITGFIRSIDSCYILSGFIDSISQDRGPFVLKENLNGQVQWLRRTNGMIGNHGFKTIQLLDGSLISSAYLYDSILNKSKVYLQKTDQSGNLQWSETFENQESCTLYDLCSTNDNSFLATGRRGQQTFIAKFDSSGANLWSRAIDDTMNSAGAKISMLSDGNFIILGQFSFSPNLQFYLAKIDPAGNLLWYSGYNGSGYFLTFKVIERLNGELIVVGSDYVNYDGFLLNTNSLGIPIFAKKYTTDPTNTGSHICDVYESNDRTLTLLGYGNFQSLYTVDFICKVDSLGDGLCNTLSDTFQVTGFNNSTIPDTFSISPYVTSTSSLNCMTYSSFTGTSNFCVNNQVSVDKERELLIYPNPVKDNLTISLTNNFTASSLEVYNSLGQKVLFKEINESQEGNINIPISLPQGIYYGRLISGQKIYSFSFTVAN